MPAGAHESHPVRLSLVMRTICIALLLMASKDWPRFRGPNGAGVSETTGLPDRFGRSENLVWRTPVPPGASSPIVAGGSVFVTAYEDAKRIVLCLDADSGRVLWRQS